MTAEVCIGKKTSHGYVISRDMTFRASVVSGWVHVDELVFGDWVYLGNIPGYKVGVAPTVTYANLGTHHPAR